MVWWLSTFILSVYSVINSTLLLIAVSNQPTYPFENQLYSVKTLIIYNILLMHLLNTVNEIICFSIIVAMNLLYMCVIYISTEQIKLKNSTKIAPVNCKNFVYLEAYSKKLISCGVGSVLLEQSALTSHKLGRCEDCWPPPEILQENAMEMRNVILVSHTSLFHQLYFCVYHDSLRVEWTKAWPWWTEMRPWDTDSP